MSSHRCPRHDLPLGATDLPFGAERCAVCSGLFLPSEEAGRLLFGVVKLKREHVADLVATRGGGDLLSCPSCRSVMPNVHLNGVWVNCCRSCGALWFDEGELKRLVSPPTDEEKAHAKKLEALKREMGLPKTTTPPRVTPRAAPAPSLDDPPLRKSTPAPSPTDPSLALAPLRTTGLARTVPAFIAHARSFRLEQEVELIEAFLDVETENRYRVVTPVGKGHAAEVTKGLFTYFIRNLLGSRRPLELEVTDTVGKKALRVWRPFFWFFSTVHVESTDGVKLGEVRQRFALLSSRYDLVDATGRAFARIARPPWKIWKFPICDDEGREVGSIEKKWSGLLKELFTDADSFEVDLGSAPWTPEQRAVFLAAGLLVDLDWFEKDPSGRRRSKRRRERG